MSQILVQPEQKLMKPSQILRNTTIEQHHGHYSDKNGKFCALGVLMHELCGWDGKVYTNFMDLYYKMIERLGLNGCIGEVIVMNDDECKSFSDIADYLESVGL